MFSTEVCGLNYKMCLFHCVGIPSIDIDAFHLPGEIINIIIEEYVQHLSGYLFKLKFDPSLLFRERFQYSNRIALEFCHLYHWHPLMPDSFLVDGEEIPFSQFMYNTSVLLHYGVEKLVDAFSRQRAGRVLWLRSV